MAVQRGFLANVTDFLGDVAGKVGDVIAAKEEAKFADAQLARAERTTQLAITAGAVVLGAFLLAKVVK